MKLKFRKSAKILVTIVCILTSCLICGIVFRFYKTSMYLANEAPFFNPVLPMDENLLIGVWENDYIGGGKEILIIQSNGKFKQLYEKGDKLLFETNWNNWWIEQKDDGRIHLHLEGARYFLNGASGINREQFPCPVNNSDPTCEEMVNKTPTLAYDWIGKEWVDVEGKLTVNVRLISPGEIILLHLWTSSDRGFPIIGGETEIYRKN